MGKFTAFDIEYARLMSHNPEGTYLYVPPSFATFHPGSVGFFDESGGWTTITDLCKEGQSQNDGYTVPDLDLRHAEPTKSSWKTRSSKTEDPSTSRAGLVVGSSVRREKLSAPFNKPTSKWASANAKRFMASEFSSHIEGGGLWIIQSVWVADECAVHMADSTDKSIDAGLETGEAGGDESFEKLRNLGWSTYQAQESKTPLVIAFSGLHFKPSHSQKFRNNPLKKAQASQYLSRDGLVDEIDFESVMVGSTESDKEEEAEMENKENETANAELGARKTAAHRNTDISDDVVPH